MIREVTILCYLLAFIGFIFIGLLTMRIVNKGLRKFTIKGK